MRNLFKIIAFQLSIICSAFPQKNNEILEIIGAISYYEEIEKSLDCIMEKFPHHYSNALLQKSKLINAHKSSLDSMKNVIIKKFGNDYLDNLNSSKKFSSCDEITFESSGEYLSTLFEDRIKGNHILYSEFVQTLIKYNPRYLKNSLKEYLDGFRTTFSTKDHPKSKGLHYTISIPKSWKIMEGERPNIIIKAIDQRNKAISLMLITKEFMPQIEFETSLKKENLDIKSKSYKNLIKGVVFNQDFINKLKENTIEFIEPNHTFLDGQPAMIFGSTVENERIGIKMKICQNAAFIIYKNYLINISLGFVITENNGQIDSEQIENGNFDVLFKSILNTLVIDDQWR